MRTGTHHYASMQAARRAYGSDCESAIAEGRIAVGRPAVPVGCTLTTDSEGRYWINEPEAPAPQLYVTKWASGDPYSREKGWRLLYAVPGSDTFTYAEGECSRKLYPTMRAAITGGQERFQEIAQQYQCVVLSYF